LAEHDGQAHRDRWARLRLLIIGQLLAAPPPRGALRARLTELAQQTWRHPISGADVRFGVSTLERWLALARKGPDPTAMLATRPRADAGVQRAVTEAVAAAIQAQYAAHPSWSVRLHHDNLVSALGAEQVPSYPTVRRYFLACGLYRQLPERSGPQGVRKATSVNEIRCFEATHVGSLFHLDGHQASLRVLSRRGEWIVPLGLCVIDDHSRLICHLQWYACSENTESLVHCFVQALQRRGLPRALHNDNGSAMIAGEFTAGLHRLGIVYHTIRPGAAWENGKQENLWNRVEGRLLAMLESVPDLTLKQLNEASYAWVEFEYQRSVHRELNGATPLERFAAGPSVLRDCPDSEQLRRAFRIEVTRKQRLSDGTVSLDGRRFEVPQAFGHLRELHVRYARWDLSEADLVDARTGAILATIRPLDKARYADGRRRRRVAPDTVAAPASQCGMAPRMRELLAQFAATGLPAAMIHHDEDPQDPP
jgi:putative transposase